MSKRKWSALIQELGDRIAGLTLAGAAELRRYLEEVHGLAPQKGPVVLPDPVVIPDPLVVPAECAVRLEGYEPTRKLAVIKVVRELTGLGLKETKDLVEGAPRIVRTGVPREEAEAMRARLEEAGGRVSLV